MLRVCKTYFCGCTFSGRFTPISTSFGNHIWLFVALWAELNTHEGVNDWPRCHCHLGRIYRKSHRFCIQSAQRNLTPSRYIHRPSPIFSVSAKEESSSEGIITVSARWGEMNGFRLSGSEWLRELLEAIFSPPLMPGSDCSMEQRTKNFLTVQIHSSKVQKRTVKKKTH
jgi:hypothetical protein